MVTMVKQIRTTLREPNQGQNPTEERVHHHTLTICGQGVMVPGRVKLDVFGSSFHSKECLTISSHL